MAGRLRVQWGKLVGFFGVTLMLGGGRHGRDRSLFELCAQS
jgi:hypothetical protein